MADQNFNVDCGFFDSVDNDRLYSADQMNMPYKRLVSNGIFGATDGSASTDFQVTASGGMVISVAAGNALFADKWFESAAAISITVPAANVSNPRIDSVIAQVDETSSGRVGRIVYRTGTPAASPTAPAINTVANVTEYRIANVSVPAGQPSIVQSFITDLRGTSACPWVTSVLAPTTTYLQTLFADKDVEADVTSLQDDIAGMVAGGRNLMLGTYAPNVDVAASYPHVLGQSGDTRLAGTASVAEHGIRDTVTNTLFPRVRFGATSGSMNGLTAGETYTLSFDTAYQLFSGDTGSSASRTYVARLYSNQTGTMTFTQVVIATITQADKGVAQTGHCSFTFTVPEEATEAYLYVLPAQTTTGYHLAGDYIELSNLRLTQTTVEAAWSPAPEDIAIQNVYTTGMTTIDGSNITDGTITSDQLDSTLKAVLRSSSNLMGGQALSLDFSAYKKLRCYYRCPSAQGCFDIDLTALGDTTIGTESGYDPHYMSVSPLTADNVGIYTVMVSVNQALTLLTVREMGYRAFADMATYIDRSNNSSYYLTKIYGFVELETV